MLSPAIRQKIESRFGRPIRYSKDCEALARSINRICADRISPTTLKRLFGFAKSVTQPRRSTLDGLANYLGYANWDSLDGMVNNPDHMELTAPPGMREQEIQPQDIYLLNQQISITHATQRIDVPKVLALAARFGRHPAFIPFLTEMIAIAGQHQDAEFLKEVYQLPGVFEEGAQDPVQIYYIGQAMGIMMRKHPDLAGELMEPLASSPHAQTYLVEWFVDEDYLEGYYGRLLDAYHRHKQEKPNDRLFYYALKHRQCMQAGDVIGRIAWYRKIKALHLPDNLYSILAARYTGICLTEERDHIFQPGSPYYQTIQRYAYDNRYDDGVNFVVFLCRELFLGKRNDWLVQLLVEFGQYQENRGTADFMHMTRKLENELMVYKAYAHALLGDTRAAQQWLDQVDPHLFDVFIYQCMWRDFQEVKHMLQHPHG